MSEHDQNQDDLQHQLEDHDEWFRHTPDEPSHQEAHGQINSIFIIAYLALTVVIVLAISAAVYQLVKVSLRHQEAEKIEGPIPRGNFADDPTIFTEANAVWTEQLNDFEWVEPGKTVRIPIDVAMDDVVRQYNN